jgi:hypothetical protein
MRYIFFFLVAVLLSNCSDTIEDSNQTIQGEYNNIFFRSEASSAHIDENGYLIIEGSSTETVRLQVENPEVGVYEILDSNNNEAFFGLDSQLFITEGENTGGRIEIEDISDNSVTGNFFFDARLNGVGERLNFDKGVFFGVPFEDPNSDEDDDDTVNENFQALVDGADFNADVTQTTISNNILNISGIQSDVIIGITLPTDLDQGDYDITADGDQNATYTQGDNAESAVDGTLTIDVLDDNQITGSFSFTTENGIEITEGQFELGL